MLLIQWVDSRCQRSFFFCQLLASLGSSFYKEMSFWEIRIWYTQKLVGLIMDIAVDSGSAVADDGFDLVDYVTYMDT